ncbi:MAG: hypothetical protein GY705_28790 [Bacteroidetes bacterium]|nr:hypothetical protein [Bacteroidota bacterium]
MIWKLAFYDAFEKMERLLLNQQNIPWQQSRTKGKETRNSLTDVIKKLVDLATANGSENANKYYTSITTMIYKEVFNLKRVPNRFRDSLSVFELHQLQLVEWKVADWLNDAIDSCFDYHEPYKEIKKKLRALVDVIGVVDLQRQLTI